MQVPGILWAFHAFTKFVRPIRDMWHVRLDVQNFVKLSSKQISSWSHIWTSAVFRGKFTLWFTSNHILSIVWFCADEKIMRIVSCYRPPVQQALIRLMCVICFTLVDGVWRYGCLSLLWRYAASFSWTNKIKKNSLPQSTRTWSHIP